MIKKLNYQAGCFLCDLSISVIIAFVSYFIFQYNTEGDQFHYREFYEFSKTSDFIQTLSSSYSYIGSLELVYPSLIWMISSILSKEIFVATLNFSFAFLSLNLARSLNYPRYLIIFFLTTNYYAILLYTSAERLKLSLIFTIISILFYIRTKRLFYVLIFGAISILTHIQTAIIFVAFSVVYFINKSNNTSKAEKLFYFFILNLVSLTLIMLLKDHFWMKIEGYSNAARDFEGLFKIFTFFCISYITSIRRDLVCTFFLLLIFSALIVGADRLVIFAYFFAMLSFPKKRTTPIKLIHFMLLLYFSYKSIGYLIDLIEYGDGFAG